MNHLQVLLLVLFESVLSCSQCEGFSQRTCGEFEIPDLRNLDYSGRLLGAVHLLLPPCLGWKCLFFLPKASADATNLVSFSLVFSVLFPWLGLKQLPFCCV